MLEQPKALPADPFESTTLTAYAAKLRSGETTALETVRTYLERIDRLNPILDCYTYVARETALEAAAAIDTMIAQGTELGPLMGVPVAIKDIVAVDGMPTRCGSDLDVSDLVGNQGRLMDTLRRAGCIILGKVATVEFAFGATGVNLRQKTPRNPWDSARLRAPGGSSSGSGVAVAAGLCAFAVGSDTGGSIRNPAAFCGVFGYKSTVGALSTDGVFPLSSTLDSLGYLTRSAADAAVIWQATNAADPGRLTLDGLRIGLPRQAFNHVGDTTAKCLEEALSVLQKRGAKLRDLSVPEVDEAEQVMPLITGPELISHIGRDRFIANKDIINVDVADRMESFLSVTPEEYDRAIYFHNKAKDSANSYFDECDFLILPTKWNVPPLLPDFDDPIKDHARLALECGGPTRSANYLGLCATSQPIHGFGSDLPVGLQLAGKGGDDARLLAASIALATAFGAPALPDMADFLRKAAA